MMLPLGLGLQVPKIPIMTIILVLLNISAYQLQETDELKLEKYLKEAQFFEKKDNLINYYKENNLLSKNTISFKSLTQAQFTHGNFMHIFGNMLVLILFGIFVEAKLGIFFYLTVYLLGGYLGCFLGTFTEPTGIIYMLGASANVFTVIGAFFVLFYRHYIKYLLLSLTPPAAKTILLPVRFSIPFFMIILEIINYLSVTILNTHTGVGHLAHLGGFSAGLLIAFIYRRTSSIQAPFIYPYEEKLFKEAQKESILEKINEICDTINLYNPMNYVVRIFVIEKAIESFKKERILDPDISQSFKKNLEPILGRYLWKKNYHKAYCLIQEIPFDLKIYPYLSGLSQRQILFLADYIFDQKDYLNAFRIYHLFLSYYNGMKTEGNILKTCDSIFTHEINNPRDIKQATEILRSDENNIMYVRYSIDQKDEEQQE